MIKQFISRLWADSLYRNSFWLMAGSFSMAGIGFFYWIIAARLYSPEQIGLATTFLSAASLISSLAMLGFGTTLIRYLPTSEVKEKKINTAFTVVVLASLVIGFIYLAGLSYWTPKLLFIRSSIPLMLLMLLFFPINSINGITDSVFTALRQAHWVFVSNVTQSLVKLVALLLFASLGVWGVIGSNMVAVLLATILSLVLISYRFSISIYPSINQKIIKLVNNFTMWNYISSTINGLPGLVMPILITNNISPEKTAYYYMPNMIATLLAIIPATFAKQYLVECSQENTVLSFKKPLLTSYWILLPSIAGILILGKSLLKLFGDNYSSEGYYFLLLVCVAVLVSACNNFYSSRLLFLNKIKKVVSTNLVATLAYLILSISLTNLGINGIGYAFIISQTISLSIYFIDYRDQSVVGQSL